MYIMETCPGPNVPSPCMARPHGMARLHGVWPRKTKIP